MQILNFFAGLPIFPRYTALNRTAVEHASETLNAIFKSIVDAIITIDGQGMIVTVNPAVEKIFGYKRNEVIGRNVSMLMPEPYRSQHDGYIENYLDTGEAQIIGVGREVTALRKDGKEIPIELTVGQIRSGVDPMFVGIMRDVSDRVEALKEIADSHNMLDVISQIQSQFIRDGDVAKAFDALLEQVLLLTDSEYGFIGEKLTQEDGAPYLRTHAITNIAWNEETSSFYEENAPSGMDFFNLDTLFGAAIKTGEPVVANDPANDPRSGGLPPGHPALNAFLGLPFHIGNRMVGMLGIANRPGGYDDEVIRQTEPLLATCGHLVGALESTRQRLTAEEALREANEQLADTVAEMTRRNEQVTLLSELEDLLQACDSLEEAYTVVAHVSKRLFPELSGAIYGIDDKTKRLHLIHHWGEGHISNLFSSMECIGIRRGRSHVSAGSSTPLNCHHVDTKSIAALCVPLIGKSETFGVLELLSAKANGGEKRLEQFKDVALTVGRRIAVTFANLRLSQNLREQSLRDPLTNLYNRRHMNDTLERELARVRRDPKGRLSVIHFDLDHFKRINDDFGHGGGDAVLAEFAAIMLDHSRASDVACRMGGEEFLLLLPDCDVEAAEKRAEEIRVRLLGTACLVGGVEIRDITVSSGVATFPDCAKSANGLLRASDEALYGAKASGRNCVVIAKSADKADGTAQVATKFKL